MFTSLINNLLLLAFRMTLSRSHESQSLSLSSTHIFKNRQKRNISMPLEDSQYLGITYASPQQYYVNNHNNHKKIRLQAKVNFSLNQLSDSKSIEGSKRFYQNMFNRPIAERGNELTYLRNTNSHFKGEPNQKCLYNFFASMWRNQNKQPDDLNRKTLQIKPSEECQRPKKSKSILLIRKINKKKEDMIMKTKEDLENEFRNKKQIPIHHSQFHFNKKGKCKTEQSPPKGRQVKNQEFTQKVQRAVEEILKLRASLRNFKEGGEKVKALVQTQQKCNRLLMVEGDHFNETQSKITQNHRKYNKITNSKNSKIFRRTKGLPSANNQPQFGPWMRRSTNDFESFL